MNYYQSSTYCSAIQELSKDVVFEGKKILITGGTGLIGSCLIDALVIANAIGHYGNEIHVITRSARKAYLRFCENVKHITIHEQSITEPIILEMEYDYIIHAASNADPKSYNSYPVETITTNIEGTLNALTFCKHHPNCRMLFLSTFEVYGALHDGCALDEDMAGVVDFNVMRSGYPESKRAAELLVRSFCKEYGVNACIARLGSVYGPCMLESDNKAHAEFLRAGADGRDIVLKSEGIIRRNYVSVFDVVSGLLFLLQNGIAGEAYNVVDSEEHSIREMAEMIGELSGSKVIYDIPEESKGYYLKPHNSVLCGDKIAALGWRKKYDLRTGLETTLACLKEAR